MAIEVVDSHCDNKNCIFYEDGCRQMYDWNCPKLNEDSEPKRRSYEYDVYDFMPEVYDPTDW